MNKIIFISFLIFRTICIAQESDEMNDFDNEYFELLNHTPENFTVDFKNKPISLLLKTNLNSIWKLHAAYKYLNTSNEKETEWFNEQISQLALSFYIEKNPVIIQVVGGNTGCPGQMLKTLIKSKVKITVVNFCEGGCIRFKTTENFIKIFNNRTENLLLNNIN